MSTGKNLGSFLKDHLDEFMCAKGFVRRKSVYVKLVGDVFHIVDFQGAKRSLIGPRFFTINCGVYVPGVVSAYLRKRDPVSPSLSDCCCFVRVGMMTPDALDKWWEVGEENATDIFSDVARHIDNLVVPFLEKFMCQEDVADFLSGDGLGCGYFNYVEPREKVLREAYSAVIFYRVGMIDISERLICSAISISLGSSVEKYVQRLYSDVWGR